jgi:hypothetical protein
MSKTSLVVAIWQLILIFIADGKGSLVDFIRNDDYRYP